jgi:hypothetical protein
MRSAAWGAGVVALIAAALPARTAPAQAGPEAELRRTELARFEAQVKGDTAALRRLLGDDLTYVHSNALTETKDHFIESVAIRRIGYDSVVPLEMGHRVFGATAVGNGKVRVQVQMNGQTIRVDLLFTTVHVRRSGRWQLVAWQSTRVP